MAQEPQKVISVVIIIAIIGVIGAIVAATISVKGNYNIEKLRQEAELTRIALVSNTTQGGATQTVPAKRKYFSRNLYIVPHSNSIFIADTNTCDTNIDSCGHGKPSFTSKRRNSRIPIST